MTINIKAALLAGTALVAVGFSTSAHAAVVAQTLTGNTEWAADANQNQSPADGSGAATADTVDLATFILTVQNDGVNNDGSGLNTFSLGAVTGTTGSLLISTSTTGANDADLTATVASVAISGAGNVTVANQDDDNSAVTATVTGALSTGGNLAVTNTET